LPSASVKKLFILVVESKKIMSQLNKAGKKMKESFFIG
jgi:hypothetical protein